MISVALVFQRLQPKRNEYFELVFIANYKINGRGLSLGKHCNDKTQK